MDRRISDVVFTSGLIIFSLAVLTSKSMVEGGVETDLSGTLLPRIVAVAIIFFSAMIGIPSLRNLLKKSPPGALEHVDTSGFLGIVVYVAILFAYWFLLPLIGFVIATSFAMLAVAVLLGGRSWGPMIAVSVIVPAVVYYGSSKYLRVFLPSWALN